MKLLSLLLASLLCLFGCSKSQVPNWYQNNGKMKVLSTTAMVDDLVQAVGQERIDSVTLITGEMDPHSYELVKGDDEKITSAEVIFSNGLNLEHGASLRYHLEKHEHVVYLGNEIAKRVPEKILYVDDELDPHVWMDISLWSESLDSIVAALSKKDPNSAEYFEKNAKQLRQEMLTTHQLIQTSLAEVSKEKRYLVTSHDAFNYFTRAYLAQDDNWRDHCVAPEGLAPEGQLSTTDIRRVIDHLCCFKISVVFPESNVSKDALRKIVSSCGQKGIAVRVSKKMLYGDAMGQPGSDADSYLKMILHNANTLKEEWMQ